ncbi:hypothetical protein SLEP1_g21175 [Rubroshorea leprosula]|uniref:Uncharacterized protein n=1 Tax=Rubroshorea leprosula TaxID=152421 RepID=A0AAV5JB53_9ROSI|nr:hypothetical protein SLEP1_g21175 [Rubroshorea leprosula]
MVRFLSPLETTKVLEIDGDVDEIRGTSIIPIIISGNLKNVLFSVDTENSERVVQHLDLWNIILRIQFKPWLTTVICSIRSPAKVKRKTKIEGRGMEEQVDCISEEIERDIRKEVEQWI